MVDFSDMDDFDTAAIKTGPVATAETTIRCVKCRGTGNVTYGYVNITTYPCGTCKGTGTVTQKRLANIDRFKKAEATRQKNEAAKRAKGEQFLAANPDIAELFRNLAERNDFVRSLQEQLLSRGELSEKQLASLQNMIERGKQVRAERQAGKELGGGAAAMVEAMATARAKGYKRATIRTEQFTFKPASAASANNGWVYVESANDKTYLGKISPEGKFVGKLDATVISTLMTVCANPLEAAIAYGRRTGNCSCCGRKLDKHASIDAGIGPICAEKFGFL